MTTQYVIQFKRKPSAVWTESNPILARGEPGYETDTGKIKIGNGTTAWNSLSYLVPTLEIANGSITNAKLADSSVNGAKIESGAIDNSKVATNAGIDVSKINGAISNTNGTVTTASTSSTVVRNITLSTSDPSGGADGDVWMKYNA